MMLRLQISTGMSSEALQQTIANNPDDIIQIAATNQSRQPVNKEKHKPSESKNTHEHSH